MRDRHALQALEFDLPHDFAGVPVELLSQSRKLGRRDPELESLAPVGQALDIDGARPVRRHGARIIGARPARVKRKIPAKPLFL